MKMTNVRSLCAGLIAVVLGACSSQTDEPESLAEMFLASAKGQIAQRREGTPQKVVVTPDMLARTQVAALQANPEIIGGSDFLKRVSQRRDSGPGTVEIWSSSRGPQVFLRNGVVVGSRGLGGGMISADAALTVGALQARADRSGLRTYVIADGDATSTEMQFQCTVRDLGTENIAIVNQVFATNHMREDCTGGPAGAQKLTNDYWVHGQTGLVRKSRQWMGPRIGYFEFVLLKN